MSMDPEQLAPWEPDRGAWNLAAAHHLLVRSGFGAKPGEAEGLLRGSVDDAIERVFAQDAHDPRLVQGVEAILASGQMDSLQAWWMSLILRGGAPLRERVTLMWHDHFATSMEKVEDHRMMHNQVQLFRDQGLGDFRELLQAVAIDPAMLRWLDGDKNRAASPNENFAREVMELFALGIGHYTEHDVKQAARAFTGWRETGSQFKLRRVDHDAGTKTLLGKTGNWGTQEAIGILLDSPHCARHIAKRLLEEFVHPRPDEEWVQQAAQLLVDEEWNIGRTIRTLLSSKLFFSNQARRSRITAPVELMAGCARSLGLRPRPARLVARCSEMGQALFYPKSVKGWDGMRQWINTGTWLTRHNSLIELCEEHAESIQAHASSLVAQLIPELAESPFAGQLSRVLAEQSGLELNGPQHAALILTSPAYHLI